MSDYTLFITVVWICVASAIALSIGELLTRAIARAAKVAGLRRGVIRSVREVIMSVWILLIAVWVLQISGLTSLLTSLTISGIIGLAVSLALQNTLSNVIAGVLLFHDRVIRAGETITYSGIKGKIVKIGLRNTWMKTEDGNIVVVSNSSLSSGPLTVITGSKRVSERMDRGI